MRKIIIDIETTINKQDFVNAIRDEHKRSMWNHEWDNDTFFEFWDNGDTNVGDVPSLMEVTDIESINNDRKHIQIKGECDFEGGDLNYLHQELTQFMNFHGTSEWEGTIELDGEKLDIREDF